jgi:hypothetical protein
VIYHITSECQHLPNGDEGEGGQLILGDTVIVPSSTVPAILHCPSYKQEICLLDLKDTGECSKIECDLHGQVDRESDGPERGFLVFPQIASKVI